MKLMSRALVGAGATSLLPNCATSGGMSGGGALPPATKDNPFVNSLGMKFVPVPGTKILMCTTETTVSQFQAMGKGYRYPPFSQTGSHPAVGTSYSDADAWCAWLSRKEGRRYRLPTDAEWSAAVGGGTYPWGNQWPPPNNAGNYSGQELRSSTPAERKSFYEGFNLIGGFSDRHKFTAPVGSYPANWLGIHDLGGNAWELCEGSKKPNIRGASWYTGNPRTLRSSYHWDGDLGFSNNALGFRCVIE